MKNGARIFELPDLEAIRETKKHEMKTLDETYKRLLNPHTYKVSLSDKLKKTKTDLIRNIQKDFNY